MFIVLMALVVLAPVAALAVAIPMIQRAHREAMLESSYRR